MTDYRIEPNGKIFSYYTNRYLKEEKMKNGYIRVWFKGKNTFVHHIIAEHFIPNPDNLLCVGHKDDNRQNNDVSNLYWTTYQENNIHNDRYLRAAATRRMHNAKIGGNLIWQEYMVVQTTPIGACL